MEELAMMKRALLAGLLLCLSLFSARDPAWAQAGRASRDDLLTKLERSGWKIAQEGVLQRQPRPGEVETFVFGVEGFAWKLRDLRSQLQVLRREFEARPTPELRRAIASHRKAIASTLEMIERARIAETMGETKELEDCPDPTFNYAYDTDAGSKTQSQGTWANASADFSLHPSCASGEPEIDPAGEVYAYAFAQTTVNGAITTATVTDGPRSGSNVNASADANRNGGASCESYAYASVTSTSLNPSSYSSSTSNLSCPAPSPTASPLQVSVTSDHGTKINLFLACVTVTWTVNVSGGTSPYNVKIYWNDTFAAHGTSLSKTFCNSFAQQSSYLETIRAEVADHGGQAGSASHTTTINTRRSCDPGPCIPN
jgi:hypothetical protein